MQGAGASATVLALAVALGTAQAHAQEATPPRLLHAPEVSVPDGVTLDADAFARLRLTIGSDGSVTEAELLEGIDPALDPRVLDAARAMTFAPATRAGEPIAARVEFRYRVSATPAPEPAPDVEPPTEAPTSPPAAPPDDEEPELGVTATIEREEEGAASRFTLRGEELTTVPGTFGEPLRAVASLPGVARSPFGLGFFLVRGSDFQNTGFLVDGFPVPLLYHVGAGPAILPSQLVSRMDFYAGNYPVRFGRYGGGLISLETDLPDVPSPTGDASVDAARAGALATIPFDEGRGAVAVGFRRSYFELIVPLIQPGLDLAFTDYQLMGRYRVDDHVSLSFFFFGANDYLDQSGQIGDGGLLAEGGRTNVAYDLQRLITTLRVRLPGGARVRLSSMIGRDGSGFEASQPGFGRLSFELEAFFAGWRLDAEIPMSEGLRARAGIDVNTLNARILGTAPVPSGLGEIPRPLPTISTSDARLGVIEAFAAAYYEQVFDFAPLELSTGLRLDLMRYGDVVELLPDPRAVARVRVHPALVLKAASGLFVQQPSPFTIFRVGGDPTIPPERSWQSSVGAELTLPVGLEAQLTAFYNRSWQIARGVDRVVPTDTGLRRALFEPDGEGHAYGLEALLRLRHEGFYGWVTYTLSRSERWSAGQPTELFAFDQTHVVNVVLSYGFDGWRFGGRFQLASGIPTRTLLGRRFDADTGGFGGVFGPRDERIDMSHRLDIRIDRDFEVGPVRGSVYLDVINVYFSELPEGRLYQYDYRRQSTLRGLPIIPSLGIRGTLQ